MFSRATLKNMRRPGYEAIKTYKAGIDGPSIEHTLVWLHTEDTWLSDSMLVLLDLRVDLVEGGVCGILTARYLDVDQPLLVKVVTKNMGGIRKQLQVCGDGETVA